MTDNTSRQGRGRGRGRGQGRGARGQGNSGKSSAPKGRTKKTLQDHVYYLRSVKQASNYKTTTEFIVNHIKKTFNYGSDIATALETETPYDVSAHKPTLKASRKKDAAKELEDE